MLDDFPYDLFLSHSAKDKQAVPAPNVVRPLAEGLRQLGVAASRQSAANLPAGRPQVGFAHQDEDARQLLPLAVPGVRETGALRLIDEAKEGPRLFSFKPIDPDFFDRPKWINQKFRLTLWCGAADHSEPPSPVLDRSDMV